MVGAEESETPPVGVAVTRDSQHQKTFPGSMFHLISPAFSPCAAIGFEKPPISHLVP